MSSIPITKNYSFNYPWELCLEAYMRRFPKHKRLSYLRDSSVISDSTDPASGIRTIHRECIINLEAPSWVLKMAGVDVFHFDQTTTIDSRRKIMKCVSRNETWKEKISIIEGVELWADPSARDSRTKFSANALLEFVVTVPASKQIQKIIMKSYDKNLEKGKTIDMAFIQDVIDEGGVWSKYAGKMPSVPVSEEAQDFPVDVELQQVPAVEIDRITALKMIASYIALLFLPPLFVNWFLTPVAGYHLGLGVVLLYSFLQPTDIRLSFMFILGETLDLDIEDLFDFVTSKAALWIPVAILFALPEWLPISVSWTAATCYNIGYLLSFAILSLHGLIFTSYYQAPGNMNSQECQLKPKKSLTESENFNSSTASSVMDENRHFDTIIEELDDDQKSSKKQTKRERARTKLFGSSNKKGEKHELAKVSDKAGTLAPVFSNNNLVAIKSTPALGTEKEDHSDVESGIPLIRTESILSKHVSGEFSHEALMQKLNKALTKDRYIDRALYDKLHATFCASFNGLVISIPCFNLRLVRGGEYRLEFLIQLQWPASMSEEEQYGTIDWDAVSEWELQTVEKPYKEFVILNKVLHKLRDAVSMEAVNAGSNEYVLDFIPDFEDISITTSRKEKDVYTAYLEHQRKILEFYLQTLIRKLSNSEALSATHAKELPSKAIALVIDFLSHAITPQEQFDVNLEPTSVVSFDQSSFVRPSLSGFVSVANWSRHWKDFKFILDGYQCAFYKVHPGGKDKLKFLIKMEWIISADEISVDDAPSGPITRSRRQSKVDDDQKNPDSLSNVQHLQDVETAMEPQISSHISDSDGSEKVEIASEKKDLRPFSGSYFLVIQTECLDSVEYYLAFKQRNILDRFLEYLRKSRSNVAKVVNSGTSGSQTPGIGSLDTNLDVEKIYNPVSGLSHCLLGGGVTSSQSALNLNWLKKESYVLNRRKFLFSTIHDQRIRFIKMNCAFSRSNETERNTGGLSCPHQPSPGKLSEGLLQEILAIYRSYVENGKILNAETAKRLIFFSINACSLTNLESLVTCSDDEKLVFYLNIYYTLMIHSFLELGHPIQWETAESSSFSGGLEWKSVGMKKLLSFASYDIGGYIFSLVFLEHSILRGYAAAPMHILSSSGSSFWTSRAPDLKKSSKDPRRKWAPYRMVEPRLDFILGIGTVSSPDIVWKFSCDQGQLKAGGSHAKKFGLNEQLSHASGHFLMEHIQVTMKNQAADNVTVMEAGCKAIIYLPRCLQWYHRDFVKSSGGDDVDKKKLFDALLPYMPDRLKNYLVTTQVLIKKGASATASMPSSPYLANHEASEGSTDTLGAKDTTDLPHTDDHDEPVVEEHYRCSEAPLDPTVNESDATSTHPKNGRNPLFKIRTKYRNSKLMSNRFNKNAEDSNNVSIIPGSDPTKNATSSSTSQVDVHSSSSTDMKVLSNSVSYMLAPNVKVKFADYNWAIRQEIRQGHEWNAPCDLLAPSIMM